MTVQRETLQLALYRIDVSDPKLYADDTWRPLFARLRREDPVHYCGDSPFGPYWSVTRYDEIFAVELDHANYSSSSELGGIQIADQPRGQERTSFIRMDPPAHTAQGRTVSRSSHPRISSIWSRRFASGQNRSSMVYRAAKPSTGRTASRLS